MTSFRALVLHEEDGKVVPRLESLDDSRLPPGDVTVRVEYSTLNYKDGMILQGQGRLVRQYPHVPGVDFAGTVERSVVARVQARRSGDPDRLAGRRIALGRLCRAGARQGRVAGAPARGAQREAGDGDRHRRVHRDAGGASRSNATASSPIWERCWSPALPAGSAASRSRCWRRSATGSSPRPGGRNCATISKASAPPNCSTAPRSPRSRPARSTASAGPARSTRSAATRWPRS